MLIGLNSEGKRINIDHAVKGNDYFCPCPTCHAKLIAKTKGQFKSPHFAHWANTKCTDSWNQEMSDWHIFWQSLFPEETQEIYKNIGDCYHRADVLIEDSKTVIEFQHSKLSMEEFQERNAFYNSLGYKVIWVFDFAEKYEDLRIKKINCNKYKWSTPLKTFFGFNAFVQKENVELFFQIEQKASVNAKRSKLIESKENGNELSKREIDYIKEHEFDTGKLIRVALSTGDDFDKFATDGHIYSIDEFVSLITSGAHRKRVLADLFDYLPPVYTGNRTCYCLGCPDSITHICSNNSIDIKANLQDEIIPCNTCEYGVQTSLDDDTFYVCNKRFIDTRLPLNTEIMSVDKNDDGSIAAIWYVDNGALKSARLNEFKAGKSIVELWHSKYELADFLNIKTKEFVRIKDNPRNQLSKYRKVYGYVSSKPFDMHPKNCEIADYSNPDWVCINNKSIDDD